MFIEIRKLSLNDDIEIYHMLQELPSDENGFLNSVSGKSFEDYKKWLLQCVLSAEQTVIVDGWKVPQSTYWLFVDNKPAGMGKIRHFLTDKLLDDGGNIGYSIRPSDRKKGLGNIFLSKLLKECKNVGVDRALLTIQKDNIPSIKVALANKGVIEKSSDNLHYIWIEVGCTK
jgi:predicted acetyltransferase